ncbi:hypothetical protein B5G21_09170 [Enorma massiliensis]|uniref:Uncharacterized protein n=2 Tax=Enorma massiliensis TaxID=1472761 RepID=A0A1Y3U5W5_9ACTN|nr:hypothetical protein B5G21_09170 [Enorma massiliensis]
MAKMMTFADYKAQVFNDAREAIREAAARIDDWSRMYDELFVDDGVTGNASGSHTFSRAAALENVRGLLGDAEFAAEADGQGYGLDVFGLDPEGLDVTARCIALACVSRELEGVYEAERTPEAE